MRRFGNGGRDRSPNSNRVEGFGRVVFAQAGHQGPGDPIGAPRFRQSASGKFTAEHQTLLERIPSVEDAHNGCSAAARASCTARVAELESAEEFCRRQDEVLLRCLCTILQIPVDWCWFGVCFKSQNTNLLVELGRLIDCVSVIRNCHPAIADRLVAELGEPSTPFLSPARGQRMEP